MRLDEKYLPNTMATQRLTFATRKKGWKRRADRSPTASSEPSDAPERRIRANCQRRISPRRPVIGDIIGANPQCYAVLDGDDNDDGGAGGS